MTDAEKLISLGVPTQLAPLLVSLMGANAELTQAIEDHERRIAALEALMESAIIADDAP